ncbi:DUF2169 family type VI secretion system accessory protein [Inquilinus sp. CA228]|uniref:DUF2169 family type VI secretion system accessory protein n=1 Tax=Inquilinus sp. CA228 TaxID=3455609 RepID=UPI003F8D77A3
MRIIKDVPFEFLPLPSKVIPPQQSLTLIVKGTFDLKNGAICTPAAKQREISGDTPYLDDIGRSLAWASDLAPFKPRTDVYVIGSFHQPGGVAAPKGRASFTLGPLHKELAFFGPRHAVRQADETVSVTAPEPMVSVPLRWEYSFGGLDDRRNPMGLGIDGQPATDGRTVTPLPLIEDPANPLRTLRDRPRPANFAPVPQGFEERRRKRGTHDRRWSVFRAPLPPRDYDPSHHNAAPDDQQAGNYPRGDETLVLRNLHPTVPTLTTGLPGLRIRAGLLRATAAGGVAAEEVPMHLDTVVAVPDDDQIVLVWRGVTPLHMKFMPDEVLVLQCEAEPLDAPATQPPLPDRMLAAYQAEEAAGAAAEQAETAKSVGEIRKLLSKAKLPPGLAKAIETETDPQVIYDLLDGHLTTILDGLKQKYPQVAADLAGI